MVETNGPKIVISLWTMTIIPFFFMLLRYFCKCRYSKLFGWDDCLLALSWVFVLIYTALVHVSVNYGIGRHFHEADMTKLPTGIKYMYLGELFALLAMPTGKTSFCVTLLRLTAVQWHKWFIWFIIVTINLTMWAVTVMTFAQCSPVEKLWDISIPGKCWDNRIVIYFSIFVGIYSCLIDVMLAFCPWLIIHKLQMKKREKFGIIVAMSLGCLASIACAIKTSYLPQIGTWQDFTFNTADVLIWGLAESSITIVAASIPFLRLLIREVSSKSGSRSNPNKNTYNLHERSKTNASRMKDPFEVYNKDIGARNDEASDKSILGEARGSAGKIVQTNEVRIEYGEIGDDVSQDSRYGKNAGTFYH